VIVSQVVAPRRSEINEVPTPEPAPGHVIVRVDASGVCSSELHAWVSGPRSTPMRLGHEAVGTVQDVGERVERWRPGDIVTGLMSQGFSQFVTAREDHLLRVPAGVLAESALGEPIGCLVNAARRTNIQLGDRTAIVGLGYMGLGMLGLCRLAGPSFVMGVDMRPEALELARELGADDVRDPAEIAEADLDGRDHPEQGFDVVIEATGTQHGLDLAGRLVRQHGILSIVGYHQGAPRSVDMESWNFKAIDVINAHVRRTADRMESMKIGLDLVSAGRLDFGRLVTHRYGLDEVDRAFADLEAKPPGFVKAVVIPNAA
jgi:threonine dehydrogenase-like Zn-dependent dehydrogenase